MKNKEPVFNPKYPMFQKLSLKIIMFLKKNIMAMIMTKTRTRNQFMTLTDINNDNKEIVITFAEAVILTAQEIL